MKIVVDTNVVISGIFFGGAPGQVLKAIISSKVTACATTSIVDEYLGRKAQDSIIVSLTRVTSWKI